MIFYVYEIVSQSRTFLASREIHWAPESGVRLVGIFPRKEIAIAVADLLGERVAPYEPTPGSLPQDELDALVGGEEEKK